MTNEEMIARAKEAGSADELVALAKKNGKELSAEQANVLFGKLHQSGELSDSELDSAAGGCNYVSPSSVCSVCGGDMECIGFHLYDSNLDQHYSEYECTKCGHIYDLYDYVG